VVGQTSSPVEAWQMMNCVLLVTVEINGLYQQLLIWTVIALCLFQHRLDKKRIQNFGWFMCTVTEAEVWQGLKVETEVVPRHSYWSRGEVDEFKVVTRFRLVSLP
jgi:hypothetical protein